MTRNPLAIPLALSASVFVFLYDPVKADQSRLALCLKEYAALGISPDAALAECKKSDLVECVKRLMTLKYQAVAIKSEQTTAPGWGGTAMRHLVDLGNDQSRWMEGKQWKEKGCFAFTQGPYRRQSDKNQTFWANERSYEWFRQGWCESKQISLEQPYSMEEAKLQCEVGIITAPEPSPSATKITP